MYFHTLLLHINPHIAQILNIPLGVVHYETM